MLKFADATSVCFRLAQCRRGRDALCRYLRLASLRVLLGYEVGRGRRVRPKRMDTREHGQAALGRLRRLGRFSLSPDVWEVQEGRMGSLELAVYRASGRRWVVGAGLG